MKNSATVKDDEVAVFDLQVTDPFLDPYTGEFYTEWQKLSKKKMVTDGWKPGDFKSAISTHLLSVIQEEK